MALPPTTPRGVLRELAKQPDVRKSLARWWMILGALMTLFVCAMAIAHFVGGVPIYEKGTDRPLPAGETLAVLCALIAGGLFFLVMGAMLRRWQPDESDDG